jgi:hypothetical protein
LSVISRPKLQGGKKPAAAQRAAALILEKLFKAE